MTLHFRITRICKWMHMRGVKTMKDLGFNVSSDWDKNMIGPEIETANGFSMGCAGSGESGFPRLFSKSLNSSQHMGLSQGHIFYDNSEVIASPPSLMTLNSNVRELESVSRFSASAIKSYDTRLDLKKGSLDDCNYDKIGGFSKGNAAMPSEGSSLLVKRCRIMSSTSQSSICIVLGCNKDLSSLKDYYKRHRVCDIHAKSAKVIVNGREQRFCQQCSRFHLLAEFDNNKRSCRKRLVCHNERRRKPALNTSLSQGHKLLQFYGGSRLVGASLRKRASFVFPGVLSDNFLFPRLYENSKQWRDIKSEIPVHSPTSAEPVSRGRTLKSAIHLHGTVKQFPSCNEVLSKLEYPFLSAASEEPPGALLSSCALSLLSAPSQNMSSHSTGLVVDVPSNILSVHHTHHGVLPNSVATPALRTSEHPALRVFYSSGLNLLEGGHVQTQVAIDGDACATLTSASHAEVLCQSLAIALLLGSLFLDQRSRLASIFLGIFGSTFSCLRCLVFYSCCSASFGSWLDILVPSLLYSIFWIYSHLLCLAALS